MGLKLSQFYKKDYLNDPSTTISYGTLITKAKGSDLIFIQDMAVFDNYSLINSQKAHHIKHLLRFKC